MTTSTRIREDVAFLLDVFDQHGIEPVHITAGLYLTGHVSAYQRPTEAVADVDRIADALGLAPDDGETTNYDRQGNVTIGDRSVLVTIYTGRPEMAEVTA